MAAPSEHPPGQPLAEDGSDAPTPEAQVQPSLPPAARSQHDINLLAENVPAFYHSPSLPEDRAASHQGPAAQDSAAHEEVVRDESVGAGDDVTGVGAEKPGGEADGDKSGDESGDESGDKSGDKLHEVAASAGAVDGADLVSSKPFDDNSAGGDAEDTAADVGASKPDEGAIGKESGDKSGDEVHQVATSARAVDGAVLGSSKPSDDNSAGGDAEDTAADVGASKPDEGAIGKESGDKSGDEVHQVATSARAVDGAVLGSSKPFDDNSAGGDADDTAAGVGASKPDEGASGKESGDNANDAEGPAQHIDGPGMKEQGSDATAIQEDGLPAPEVSAAGKPWPFENLFGSPQDVGDTACHDQEHSHEYERSTSEPLFADNINHVGESKQDEGDVVNQEQERVYNNELSTTEGFVPDNVDAVRECEENDNYAKLWEEFDNHARRYYKNAFAPHPLQPVGFEQWKKLVSRNVEVRNYGVSPLASLPKELRLMIWDYVLEDVIAKTSIGFNDRNDAEVDRLAAAGAWEKNHSQRGAMPFKLASRIKTARESLARLGFAKHVASPENPEPYLGDEFVNPRPPWSVGWWSEPQIYYVPLRSLAILLVSRAVSREAASVLYSKIALEPMSVVILNAFLHTIGPVNRSHIRNVAVIDPHMIRGIKLDNLHALNTLKLGLEFGLQPPKRLHKDIKFGAFVDTFEILYEMRNKLRSFTILIDAGHFEPHEALTDDNNRNITDEFMARMPANKRRILYKRENLKRAIWLRLANQMPLTIDLKIGIPGIYMSDSFVAEYLFALLGEEADNIMTRCEDMADRFGWRFVRPEPRVDHPQILVDEDDGF